MAEIITDGSQKELKKHGSDEFPLLVSYEKLAKGGIALSSGRITESGICGKETWKTGRKRRTERVR